MTPLRLPLPRGAAALPLLALATPAAAHDGGPAGSDWIFYDWVEDGELRGGRVRVDAANPLHAAQGPVVPLGGAGGLVGTPVATLVDSGDPSNRIDLVVVGDGYTAAELDDYAEHVDDMLPTLLAEPPLDVYASLFNVHRVDVVSNESGVDNDPVQGVSKDTALDMGYWCGGTERLLCVNVAKALGFAANAPDVDQVLALAHSTKYGGAGYSGSDLATVAGDNFSSIEIALHELGHSLGNLADEYTYGGPATYAGSEPASANLSKKNAVAMANQAAKWHLWLDTPAVDTFEGGGYSVFGIYRPTNNSLMRNLGRPFQEVNSEQLVVEIYKTVRPVDDASPAGIYLESDVLWVDPVDPGGAPLAVQWRLDGTDLAGETGLSLDLGALALADGLYTVSCVVTDETPLVRDPDLRIEWLTETREWTVSVGDDPPPFVASASAIQAHEPELVTLEGGFLDQVTAARIGGVAATIQAQAFDTLKLLPAAPGVPGFADVELDTADGTTTFPDAVSLYPTLAATSGGPGGLLETTLRIGDFSSGQVALFYGYDVYPAPVPLPGIHHGWLLDFSFPVGLLTAAPVALGVHADAFSIPDQPALEGLEIRLQAWTEEGFPILATQSFTEAVAVTL